MAVAVAVEERKVDSDEELEIIDNDFEVNDDDPEEVALVERTRQKKQVEFRKAKYDAAIARFEAGGSEEHAQFFYEYNYKLKGKDVEDEGEVQRRFQLLCTELKFLYVAITRPKNRLFIYDADTEARKPIENIWTKLDAVQRVTQEDLLRRREERSKAATD